MDSYEVIIPKGIDSMCCGMVFDSRGFCDSASGQLDKLQAALATASERGKLPIVCDTSPCLQVSQRVPGVANLS